jgi:hypothetical protein
VNYYNLLQRLEYTSNWALFSIMLAVKPEISRWDPPALYLLEDTNLDITLHGNNFIRETEVFLEREDGENTAALRGTITANSQGNRAVVAFKRDELVVGQYRLRVVNPGDLEAIISPFEIAYGKPFTLNIAASYAPLFPLQGFLSDFFDEPSWIGANIHASLIPYKRPWGYLGAELSVSWNRISMSKNSWDLKADLFTAHAELLYRKLFVRQGLAFNGRLGGGMSGILGLSFKYGDEYNASKLSAWYPSINAGASVQWYFQRHFFAELGADYLLIFSKDSPQPGYLRPIAALGWEY